MNNNSSMNRENKFTNLGVWCEQYHKHNGIKIHPSSVPVDLVLEDALGYIALLNGRVMGLSGALDHAVARIAELEKMIVKEPEPVVVEKETKSAPELKHTSTKKGK